MNEYTHLVLDGEDVYVHLHSRLIFPSTSSSYIYPVLQSGQDLRNLAYVIYGDTSYWVLIAILNKIYDPFSNLSGSRLKVVKPGNLHEVKVA